MDINNGLEGNGLVDLRKVDMDSHIMRNHGMKLHDFAGSLGANIPEDISGNILKIGRNYFLSNEQMSKVRSSIKRDVFSVGLFLGEEKNFFMPSPAFIDILAKTPDAGRRKIFINKKAEWLFLCGRNILMDSISKNPHNLSEGYVFVQNEHDENLGYGLFKKEDTLIIKHILDKGAYLRIEDKKGRKSSKP